MRSQRLFWHIYPAYLVLITFLIFAFALIISGLVTEGLKDHVVSSPLVIQIYQVAFIIELIFAIIGAFICDIAAKKISGPINDIYRAISHYARNDFDARIQESSIREINNLIATVKDMSSKLELKSNESNGLSNEQIAMLECMTEGVLAVDNTEKIIKLNQAASTMLNIDIAAANGRQVQEIVRNSDIQKFISKTLSGGRPVEGQFIVNLKSARYFQAHGTVLRDSFQKKLGALIVLNDITELKRLENIRKDFVANVSHELKTPVTSIKGFVETLLDGAIDNVKEARQFLDIILKQSDRLNAIIEDLLNLSRIERDIEGNAIALEKKMLSEIVKSAVENAESKATDKRIIIESRITDDIVLPVNPILLEQAIFNLLDNAIKYSDPTGKIIVSLICTSHEAVISVEDHGRGIPAEYLPRIFERFYRVDNSRSDSEGGTGLGLAIAKHIAIAHKGDIEVESAIGKGSIFRIHLPI